MEVRSERISFAIKRSLQSLGRRCSTSTSKERVLVDLDFGIVSIAIMSTSKPSNQATVIGLSPLVSRGCKSGFNRFPTVLSNVEANFSSEAIEGNISFAKWSKSFKYSNSTYLMRSSSTSTPHSYPNFTDWFTKSKAIVWFCSYSKNINFQLRKVQKYMDI